MKLVSPPTYILRGGPSQRKPFSRQVAVCINSAHNYLLRYQPEPSSGTAPCTGNSFRVCSTTIVVPPANALPVCAESVSETLVNDAPDGAVAVETFPVCSSAARMPTAGELPEGGTPVDPGLVDASPLGAEEEDTSELNARTVEFPPAGSVGVVPVGDFDFWDDRVAEAVISPVAVLDSVAEALDACR